MKKRVLIAMSGGVDSTVAAYLMVKAGYECAGVTMRQFRNHDVDWQGKAACCSYRDMEDAAKAAYQLGIPHAVLDYTAKFRREVIDRFAVAYDRGLTPNPCLDCNRYMRAGHLMDYARKKGFDYIATGHYARIERDDAAGQYVLRRGVDGTKDQAYVHYAMTQEQLAHTLFPLGGMEKADVRALAAELGFLNADKRDSQDICFIPDGDYGAFLERYTGKTWPSGDFLDMAGHSIGRHNGAVRYTLGQRRGLSLPMGGRVYVTGKSMADNTVTVGPETALFSSAFTAGDVNWIAGVTPPEPITADVQTRYRQQPVSAVVIPMADGTVRVELSHPQRAVTPGQAAVFYSGDTVLGGGTILHTAP